MAASSGDAHPWPIYNARFRVVFPILDADGDPVTGAASLDSEVSQDQGTFADCTNEATEIATSSGSYYLDLVAGELDTQSSAVQVKTATAGAKTTLLYFYPKRLPVIRTGTAQAGASTTITLDSGASAVDDFYNGCYVNCTNNSPSNVQGQARRITDYVGSTKVATVATAWGTNPSSATTFEILAPGDTVNVAQWAGTQVADPSVAGVPETDVTHFGGTAGTFASGRAEVNVSHISGSAVSTSAAQIGVNVVNFGGSAGTFASGRPEVNASHIGGSAISQASGVANVNVTQLSGDSVAADNAEAFFDGTGYAGTGNTIPTVTTVSNQVTANVTGISGDATAADNLEAALDGTGGVTITAALTGNITGNLSGSVGSVTGAVGSVTGAVGSVTTVSDKTGYRLSATGVDDVWDEATSGHTTSGTFGQALNIIRAGTAQAGAAGTITLDASASATDDFYNNQIIVLTSGTGAPQARVISDYVGSTKVASVNNNWATNPSSDSVFVILPFGLSPASAGLTAADVWGHTTRELTSGANLGTVAANVTQISGDSAAADNAESFFDGTGYAGTNNVIPTVTTLTNAPSDSAGVTTLLSRIPSGIFTGMTSLAQWLGLMAGKQTGNSTARTELRATGGGSGTFDETTDSLEAVRDNTGTAGAGLTALGDTRMANLDATVSSRLASASYTAPPSAATNASAVRTELTTELGRIDAAVSTRATPAQVNTEVLDVLVTDTFAEPSAPPAATASLKDKIGWNTALARNKVTQTSTTQTLRNDADSGNIGTSTVSDDGTTFTKGEWS